MLTGTRERRGRSLEGGQLVKTAYSSGSQVIIGTQLNTYLLFRTPAGDKQRLTFWGTSYNRAATSKSLNLELR